MLSQYEEYPEFEYSEKSRWPLYVLIGVVILLTIAAFFIILKPKERASMCGDGICDTGENCYNCASDCGCAGGQYCSPKSQRCVSYVCGNGACEPGESAENCCNDCGCRIEGEVCNNITHRCEIPTSGISEEKARELVENYLKQYNATNYEISVGSDTIYEGKPGRFVYVSPKDRRDREETTYFVVTTDGEVYPIGFPI
ncbi:MAG: hypothetical protein QXQ40_02360 [Candidatus Aenigmatarchaeota archaeon]